MQLTAYVVSDAAGWTLEPAPLERAWMDETPSHFAYRCLPLVMANQAGWIVRNPVGFRARWIETQLAHCSVQVDFDSETERWLPWISSHFGSGVLTFSLPWLFRTPRPICLRASGLPNWWKDGAHALEGLIETFWSPYTFTMNWKVTRQNEWIRFEKGEPICFLQPVAHAALAEQLEPRILPIASDPAVDDEFAAWTDARLHLIENPTREAEWQKNYFQGRLMSGASEVEHRSRLAVKKFESG